MEKFHIGVEKRMRATLTLEFDVDKEFFAFLNEFNQKLIAKPPSEKIGTHIIKENPVDGDLIKEKKRVIISEVKPEQEQDRTIDGEPKKRIKKTHTRKTDDNNYILYDPKLGKRVQNKYTKEITSGYKVACILQISTTIVTKRFMIRLSMHIKNIFVFLV